MGLIDGIIGGVVDLGLGITGAVMGHQQFEDNQKFVATQAKLGREHSTSEREAAQEYNTQQIEDQRLYNSPVEQLKRAAAAGINPNSVVQGLNQGNVQQGLAQSQPGSSPIAGSPDGSWPSTLANLVGNSANSALSATLQAGQLEELLEGVKKDNKLKDQEIEDNEIDLKYKEEFTQEELKKIVNENAEIKERIEQIKSARGLTEAQTYEIYSMLPVLLAKGEAEVTELEEKAKNLMKQRQVMDEEMKKIRQDVKTSKSQEDLNRANIGLVEEQTQTEIEEQGLIRNQADKAYQEQLKIGLENNALEWKELYREATGMDPDANFGPFIHQWWNQTDKLELVLDILGLAGFAYGGGVLSTAGKSTAKWIAKKFAKKGVKKLAPSATTKAVERTIQEDPIINTVVGAGEKKWFKK